MSKDLSTVMALGAKAPFILVMALSIHDRIAFVNAISPSLLPALKVRC